MYISDIQERLTEIISQNDISDVRAFMVSNGANEHEMTDAYHLALWIEGAPAAVKCEFLDKFNEDDNPEMRICDTCGCFMIEGYLLGDMMEHYCSRKCAIESYIADALRFTNKKISYKEAERRLNHDLDYNSDDCFWTEWY